MKKFCVPPGSTISVWASDRVASFFGSLEPSIRIVKSPTGPKIGIQPDYLLVELNRWGELPRELPDFCKGVPAIIWIGNGLPSEQVVWFFPRESLYFCEPTVYNQLRNEVPLSVCIPILTELKTLSFELSEKQIRARKNVNRYIRILDTLSRTKKVGHLLDRSNLVRSFRSRALRLYQVYGQKFISRSFAVYKDYQFEEALNALQLGENPVSDLFDEAIFNNFKSAEFPRLRRAPERLTYDSLDGGQLKIVNALKQASGFLDTRRSRQAVEIENLKKACYHLVLGSSPRVQSNPELEDTDVKEAFLAAGLNSLPEVKPRFSFRKNFSKPRLSIIVPIYNNGHFFLGRCLPSLLANRVFFDSELILVDDGSNDRETISIIRRVASILPNVQMLSAGNEPSGTASRARNRGLLAAEANLVSFIDPDNELSPFALDNLLEIENTQRLSGDPVDFVSGYQLRIGSEIGETGRHTFTGTRVFDGNGESLFYGRRPPVVSSQAAVFSRDFLLSNKIHFAEGAVGQDTLFGWEVVLRARRFVFTDQCFVVYYTLRAGSVTNYINRDFFARSLLREMAQVALLKEFGLFGLYRKKHFRRFLEDWYQQKIERCEPQERIEAEMYLTKIVNLYYDEVG